MLNLIVKYYLKSETKEILIYIFKNYLIWLATKNAKKLSDGLIRTTHFF